MPVRVEALLQLLRGSPLVRRIRVVDYDETPAGSLELKLRCQLVNGHQFQVWLHLSDPRMLILGRLCHDPQLESCPRQ